MTDEQFTQLQTMKLEAVQKACTEIAKKLRGIAVGMSPIDAKLMLATADAIDAIKALAR